MDKGSNIGGKMLIEPFYFGSIEFFALVVNCSQLIFEVSAYFVKQTYRNRAQILTANGPLDLVIPVHFKNHTALRDVTIDYSQSWVKDHKRAIHSAYAKSPFYEYYEGDIMGIIDSKPKFLIDLTIPSVTKCLEILAEPKSQTDTKSYSKHVEEEILDLRDQLKSKVSFRERSLIEPRTYIQNFGKKFVPNLSILDLLFCLGPESSVMLRKILKSDNEQ